MSSFYTVIRYTPNPIAEESINFGVIVFHGSDVEIRFTDDWHRAKTFGRKTPEVLRSVVRDLTKLYQQNALNEELIRKRVESWQREVTFTVPRASLLEPEVLIEQLSADLLRFPMEASHQVGKRQVVKEAKAGLTEELARRFKVSTNRARTAVKSRCELQGRVKEHVLDLGVYNGVFLGGGIGVSLSVAGRAQLDKEIDSVAFVIEDLRGGTDARKRPLAVICHTSNADTAVVDKAAKVFKQLGATFVPEKRVPGWSKSFVSDLPEHVFAD
jgi:hypothetical protein